jgi:hypothetical protein
MIDKHIRYCKLLLILIFLNIHFGSSLHAQFLQVLSDLELLNSVKTNEQIYLHNDREVYAPGDTIWFKAYLRNKISLESSNLSKVFHVLLVNHKGIIADQQKYLILNSQSEGYMAVPGSSSEGKYTLICYSSWMKNFNPDEVFKKRIQILNDSKEGYQFIPYYNKTA